MYTRWIICLALITALTASPILAQDQPVALQSVRVDCPQIGLHCGDFDAVVFVHGIYGDSDTFKNGDFDWPSSFPSEINGRNIDVFRVNYKSAFLSWARKNNPQFDDIADQFLKELSHLRRSNYRSVGFIAHSLGGNVVTAYLNAVKAEFGHPQRSQHAFLITLGTPRRGAQIANIWNAIKEQLGIRDDLLESLKDDNLYLRMARSLANAAGRKSVRYSCRPLILYVGYETQGIGSFTVVPLPDDRELSAALQEFRDLRAFDLNHLQISKPRNRDSDVYKWVNSSVADAYEMIATWGHLPLCIDIPFRGEDQVATSDFPVHEWLFPLPPRPR